MQKNLYKRFMVSKACAVHHIQGNPPTMSINVSTRGDFAMWLFSSINGLKERLVLCGAFISGKKIILCLRYKPIQVRLPQAEFPVWLLKDLMKGLAGALGIIQPRFRKSLCPLCWIYCSASIVHLQYHSNSPLNMLVLCSGKQNNYKWFIVFTVVKNGDYWRKLWHTLAIKRVHINTCRWGWKMNCFQPGNGFKYSGILSYLLDPGWLWIRTYPGDSSWIKCWFIAGNPLYKHSHTGAYPVYLLVCFWWMRWHQRTWR